MTARPAVFLDRDGTLNRERGYLATAADLEVLPGVRDALRRLSSAGLVSVVVTNQSAVARGLLTEPELARIHALLHERLGRLPGAYLHCPHHPDFPGPYGRDCTCRKPQPGLVHLAAELLGVTLAGSFTVGDKARDLLLARGLPMRTVLVKSGAPWREAMDELERAACPPDHVADDVAAAADWILAQHRERRA